MYMYRCLSFHCVQSQAEAAIEEVCSKLGPLKDECDSVVKDYFPQIWQLLMSQVVSVRVYVPMVLLVGTFFSLFLSLSPPLSLSPSPSLSQDPDKVCAEVGLCSSALKVRPASTPYALICTLY